ncbi:hypothetical protein B0H15DRAFT_946099 [Mycena belliarum]|uniref:Uncharacterized protein n=1 Tax=Mycena belliarum TaxID=1033014 RepID=A0AAD6XUG6_9AGAR|nr:hypothetical protein B0H15DRAFT_946099 [Mycena belliae]
MSAALCQCRLSSTKVLPGDVCAVRCTSVEVPLMELLIQAMEPTPLKEADEYYKTLKSPEISTGKPSRPCLVLPPPGYGPDAQICLMATFGKKHPDVLPEMYKEFIAPVHPNIEHTQYGSPMLFIPKDYFTSHQWIVAAPIYPISGKSLDLQLWSKSPRVHMCVGMLRRFVSLCDAKKLDWEEKVNYGIIDVERYYTEMRANKGGGSYRSTFFVMLVKEDPSFVYEVSPLVKLALADKRCS